MKDENVPFTGKVDYVEVTHDGLDPIRKVVKSWIAEKLRKKVEEEKRRLLIVQNIGIVEAVIELPNNSQVLWVTGDVVDINSVNDISTFIESMSLRTFADVLTLVKFLQRDELHETIS